MADIANDRGLRKGARRALAGIAAAAVAGLTLVGCGAGGDGGKTEVVFWYWAADAPGADEWLDQVIEAYAEVEPDVTVKSVPQSADTLSTNFMAAAAAGSGPDIATLWQSDLWTASFADQIVPVDELFAADEIAHWTDTEPLTVGGKLYGIPQYVFGFNIGYRTDLFEEAGIEVPESGRMSIEEFEAACDALLAAGITPIAGGNKTGDLGGWLHSIIGSQNLDSASELVAASVGQESFDQPKFMDWYELLQTWVDRGYFNDDVNNLDFGQGMDLFGSGGGAIGFGTDGNIALWTEQLGSDKVGAMLPPKWGTGALADTVRKEVQAFVIPKWSPNQQAAADFLTFMHSDENIASWYEITKVVPADDRFDSSAITDPVQLTLADWSTRDGNWPQDWMPAQINGDANLPAGQLVFAGSGSLEDVVRLWTTTAEAWQSQQPQQVVGWTSLVD